MNNKLLDPEKNVKNFVENIDKNNSMKKNYLHIKEINFDPSNNYILKNSNNPFVIKGFCKNTNAYKNWNINNIADVFGDKKVNVESYSNFYNFYNARIDKHKKYTIKEVIERSDTEYLYVGEVGLKKFKKKKIIDDVKNPFINENILESVIFFGKNGSSSTHIHNSNDYVLNQIFGEKTLYMFDLRDNYNNGLFLGNPCLNETNFINKHFELKVADHHLYKLYKVTLQPGDTLIIPPWWWHNAVSHDFSCSITHKIKRTDYTYFFKYPELIINQFLIFLGCREISKTIDVEYFENFLTSHIIILFVFSISVSFFVLSILLYSFLLFYIYRLGKFYNLIPFFDLPFYYFIIITIIFKILSY